MSSCHNFEHEAMATAFSIRIYHPKEEYARQAAMEAFRECSRLEENLSRFVESSSINRINHARKGDEVRINADAYLCLRQALHIAEVTGGAFDIGFRSRPTGKEYQPAIELSEDTVSVRILRDNPKLDLGGIGKGYAIDKMVAMLEEWEIKSALVSGGWSTLLALGHPPGETGWPVNIQGDMEESRSLPGGWSISASGFSVKEDHVKDPHSGKKAERYVRSWALAQSAAVSDALSTVFLILDESSIEDLLEDFSELGAVLELKTSEFKSIGKVIPSILKID